MNQDFTVQKNHYLTEKKIRAEGFTWKKIPAQAVSEKKKFVQAKNSPPPPPHHFSNGPSLNTVIQQNEHYFKLLFQFSTASIIRAFMRWKQKNPS